MPLDSAERGANLVFLPNKPGVIPSALVTLHSNRVELPGRSLSQGR